ncbi:MAG: hypothetical protein MR283_00970 [Erysipelotrichaceae bacterium]|nr:hypothetical protein [Erysipelotrichaceae bacterium]MDY6034067.1 hypothetical protein [Bulleidia sp.]
MTIISGASILILPAIFNVNALWFAMPVTELIILIGVIVLMLKDNRELGIQ